MKIHFVPAILTLSTVFAAQVAAQSTSHSSTAVIEDTAVHALSFEKGDFVGFNKAKASFTPQGWEDFLKTMQGFLDDKGAPTFSSKFVPADHGLATKTPNGSSILKIPGTLTQTQGNSRTTYRLRLDVKYVGTPPKIEHLDQVTCAKERAANYCM
jgi:hypothetical protein